ncbi:MAG TPA: alpha/beta fold hydrolase [Flavitalea sp.]|nr:alpha/beta fold hydrolase [Flavitalea sp.]
MKLAQKVAIGYIRAKIHLTALVSEKKAAAIAFDVFCTPVRKSHRKLPKIFEKGEKLTFELERITIRGHRWNAGGERKILIVHGFESSSKNFDRYILPLTQKGFQVLAFDAPAHGRSGGKQVNLPLYTRMLLSVVKNYGPFAGYLGHSFGGLALAHLVEKIPHDINTRLVLIAPATETTSAIESFFAFLQLDTALRKPFDDLIIEKGGVPAAHYSVRRAIKHIHARILWIHDEEDEITSLADALKVRDDNHSQLEFVITKGLGHRRIYKDNQVVKRVVEFLGV